MTLFSNENGDWRQRLRRLPRLTVRQALQAANLDPEQIAGLEEILLAAGYVIAPVEPVEGMWQSAGQVMISDQPPRSHRKPVGEYAAVAVWRQMVRDWIGPETDGPAWL